MQTTENVINKTQHIEDLICKICRTIIGARSHCDRERLESVGICADCDFWIEKWQMRNDENVARIGGEHYIYGHSLQDYEVNLNDSLESIAKNWVPAKKGYGMGGSKTIIKFNDGRIVITNDLWHQGTIPERFKHTMPDNAEMVSVS